MYFKNANYSGAKLSLNSNSQILMAAKISGSTVLLTIDLPKLN